MAVKAEKFLSAFYNEHLREKMKMRIAMVAGPSRPINLTFNARESGAYTALDGKSKEKMRIVIGGQMIKKVAGLPDTFSNRETVKSLIKNIILSFYALINHELGHDIFTDMKDRSIIDYPEAKYRGFIHNTFNILEDQVIEFNMEMLYRKEFTYDINPRVYFDFMIEQLFIPQGAEYKDDGTQAGFLNYLLLFMRIGKDKIKNKCAVWEKYEADLIPLIRNVVAELDPTERIHKTITLCEWIIENIKEFDWEMPEPDEDEKVSGKAAGTPIAGAKAGSTGMPMPGGTPGGSPSGSSSGDSEGAGATGEDDGDGESEEGASSKEDEDEDEKDDEEDGADSAYDSSRVEDTVDEDIFDEVFNDVIHDGDDHEWAIAKDEYEVINPDIVDKINDDIDKFSDVINDVSNFLKLFKGRIKPMRMEGLTSGRLSARRAMADEASGGGSLRVFKKKVSRGKDADLVVSLVTDNSGSMSGEKSHICHKACLALAQACDWAGIPFEVNAFTKTHDGWDGISCTITEKALEDDFEKSKPYFAVNDSDLIRGLKSVRYIPTFRGNSEEVNLYYIWQKFRKVKHRTKLMFVLCDGETTGSRNDLKTVVSKMEAEDGIIVIGVGILCRTVVDIYNHAKVFNNMSELETDLAPYLIDTLSKYAK